MQKIREIPWVRIGAESAAIVASILLAFAIDAWWTAELERRTQSEELTRLHEEFTRIHEQLGRETSSQEETHAAVAELFQLVQGHVDRNEPLRVPNELLGRATSSSTADLVTPVLDGLVLSGRLDSIQSQDVVSAVAGWQQAISEVREIEQTSRGLGPTYLIPSLTERANMGDVLARKNTNGSTMVSVDDELEGHLGLRLTSTLLVNTRLDSLRVSLDNTLGAIEQAQDFAGGTR